MEFEPKSINPAISYIIWEFVAKTNENHVINNLLQLTRQQLLTMTEQHSLSIILQLSNKINKKNMEV